MMMLKQVRECRFQRPATCQTELADQAIVISWLLHVWHRSSQIMHLMPELARQFMQGQAWRLQQGQELTRVDRVDFVRIIAWKSVERRLARPCRVHDERPGRCVHP